MMVQRSLPKADGHVPNHSQIVLNMREVKLLFSNWSRWGCCYCLPYLCRGFDFVLCNAGRTDIEEDMNCWELRTSDATMFPLEKSCYSCKKLFQTQQMHMTTFSVLKQCLVQQNMKLGGLHQGLPHSSLRLTSAQSVRQQ